MSSELMIPRIPVSKSNFEETAGLDGLSENHHVSLPSRGIFAVADGLGGQVHGKAAAKLSCDGVVEFLTREAGDREATMPFVLRSYFSLAGNVLFNAIIHAHRQLLARNAARGIHEKGAASVVAGFVDRDTLALASVGSLSAWLLREGRVRELVSPRSWGRLVDPVSSVGGGGGWMERIPMMALGVGEDLEPEIIEVRLRPGDRLWVGTHAPESWLGLDKPNELQALAQDPQGVESLSLTWEFG